MCNVEYGFLDAQNTCLRLNFRMDLVRIIEKFSNDFLFFLISRPDTQSSGNSNTYKRGSYVLFSNSCMVKIYLNLIYCLFLILPNQ